MKRLLLLLTALFAVRVTAQATTTGADQLLSILVSEAFSVFTSITSAIGDSTTATSASAQTTSDDTSLFASSTTSDTSATSSSGSSVRHTQTLASATSSASSSSSSLSSSLITSQTGSSATASSASGTSNASQSNPTAESSGTSSAAPSSSSSHGRTLAIVLGTVLGALALGLLLLLLLLCCRRRRRRRAAARHGSLSSVSDEALAAQKVPSSHVAPVAGANHPRRFFSLNRGRHVGEPLMAERANYDVPPSHEFADHDSAPFVPRTVNGRGSSRSLPLQRPSGPEQSGSFREGTGLNNHPPEDEHHVGSMLAAGAGGAALGAAAANRHSRSSERAHQPRASGDPGVHPAFWDEPPPRSPHRGSTDSAKRRSGGMPQGPFYGPQDHANSPLRNASPAAATGGATGMTAAADNSNRRSWERGRRLPSNPPPYDRETIGTNPNAPRTKHNELLPEAGAAALGAGVGHHNHSRSRSRSQPQSHPPLPTSLMIQNPAGQRSTPSRSPKQARFSNSETSHEPMPYGDPRLDHNGVSPPTTAKTVSTHRPMSSETSAIREPVSPLSPEDVTRSFGQGLPARSGRANLVDVPRSRSISPSPPGHYSDLVTSPGNPSIPTTNNAIGATSSKPRSGLVNAVQDQLNTSPGSAERSQMQRPTYRPYAPPGMIQGSEFPLPPTSSKRLNAAPSKPSGPIARKPVPWSQYNNTARPQSTQMSNNATSDGDAWWRGQEDMAWAQSYAGRDNGRQGMNTMPAR